MATMKRGLQFLIPLVLSGLTIVLFSVRGADAQVPPSNLEIMLAVDTSGSMRVAIEAAKSAANEFVASMPANVPIGVETFGDSVTVLTSPTLDRTTTGAKGPSLEQLAAQRKGQGTKFPSLVVGVQKTAPYSSNRSTGSLLMVTLRSMTPWSLLANSSRPAPRTGCSCCCRMARTRAAPRHWTRRSPQSKASTSRPSA